MSELIYLHPLPEHADIEREYAIAQSSVDIRRQEMRAFNTAAKYLEVITGDGPTVRKAAHWLIQNAGVVARGIPLNDPDQIEKKRQELLESAEGFREKAERTESWAASLYNNADSPDVVQLKNVGELAGLDLCAIDQNPKLMVDFEDRIAKDCKTIDELRVERARLAEIIDTKEGLDTADLTDAVKKIKPHQERPVTATKLVMLQHDIVANKISDAYEELDTKQHIVNTLRSGKCSSYNLWATVESKNRKLMTQGTTSTSVPAHELTPEAIIEDMALSIRVYNCLKRAGFETVGEVIARTESELSEIPNFGQKAIDQIKEVLAGQGLALRNDRE